MSFGRYLLLKFVVGFALFGVVLLPFLFFAGWLGSLMPKAAAPLAFALAGLVWLLVMTIGTHMLTEKLSKRWSK